jgi:hypothetical protein
MQIVNIKPRIIWTTANGVAGIVLLLIFFASLANAAMLLKNRRLVYPTIIGSEYQHQVDILKSSATVKEKKEALRLLGGSPPSYDQTTIRILLDATRQPPVELQTQAIESLSNIGRADNPSEYEQFGGELSIEDLQAEIVPRLIELLYDPNDDLEESAADAFGLLPPSDRRVVKELIAANSRIMPGSNARNGEASGALAKIASQIRQRELFDWAPEIELIAKTLDESYLLPTGTPPPQAELKAFRQDLLLHRWQWLIDNWQKVLAALITLHVMLYLAVIIGTRWSTKCCRLLCDPVFSKLSVYAYPVIRYSWHVQKWILHQYFISEARQVHEITPFVAMPLTKIGESAVYESSDNLILKLRHVWITGSPGMGKTCLVKHLHDLAFPPKEQPNEKTVLTRLGIVPIFATLRDFGSVEIDLKNEPDGWVVAIVQRILGGRGAPIQDKGILRGMLRSGRIALVLDGANETSRSAEIYEYSRLNSETPILVTSQNKPDISNSDDMFVVLALPNTIEEFIQPIVNANLEPAKAKQLLAHITASGLRSTISNGYDIRLVIDLALQASDALETLPTTRLGLYEGCVALLRPFGDWEETVASLSFKAWKIFAQGDRRLNLSEMSGLAIEALLDHTHPILRRVQDDQAEFRHDQMRAFFAAKYLALFPPYTRIANLRESEVWKQRGDEQEALWSFVAELGQSCHELGIMWLFSIEKPAYGILQHMLQTVGKSRGCSWLPDAEDVPAGASGRPRRDVPNVFA